MCFHAIVLHAIVFSYLKLVKNKISKHAYFLYDLEICFDYCDDVLAKLKYLSLYDYTFNPVLLL